MCDNKKEDIVLKLIDSANIANYLGNQVLAGKFMDEANLRLDKEVYEASQSDKEGKDG